MNERKALTAKPLSKSSYYELKQKAALTDVERQKIYDFEKKGGAGISSRNNLLNHRIVVKIDLEKELAIKFKSKLMEEGITAKRCFYNFIRAYVK